MTAPLLRAKAVGEILDLSDQGVLNLVRAGLLRAVVFRSKGKRDSYRFHPQWIEEFISNNCRGGQEAGGR